MDKSDRYQVDIARNDPMNLKEVLAHIATRDGHVGIVSVLWHPVQADGQGLKRDAHYTIISEKEV